MAPGAPPERAAPLRYTACMPPPELAAAEEMLARLERLIAVSPADSTEAAWVEVQRAHAVIGGSGESAGSGGHPAEGAAGAARRERTLFLRVRQGGRTGLHRTGCAEPAELETALRDALAQARLAAPAPHFALAGPGGGPGAGGASGSGAATALHDQALADLTPAAARTRLLDLEPRRGEDLRLAWLEGHVAVANSAGARRLARVTAACGAVRCGNGAGAGSAGGAARRLDQLRMDELLEQARGRRAPGGAEQGGGGGGGAMSAGLGAPAALAPGAIVLSEQAAAALLDLLNRHALSSAAWRGGAESWWPRGLVGKRVAAPCVSLRDDAAQPAALPFPFDLAGWPKRPVELIAAGIFLTPAVDASLAAAIGRSPTPHAVAPDESLPANLVLWPGDAEEAPPPLAEAELLQLAEGGWWIGELADLAAFDAPHLRFRAVARGVRRIGGGERREAVPDLTWEDSVPELLAGALALGDRPAAIPTGDPLFGATLTPALALRTGGRWEARS